MLNHESIDRMCRDLPAVTVGAPFGPENAVYKVGAKMFALLSLDQPRLNLKCDPDRALELRERHDAVEPGYHMSKKHWNSIYWEREQMQAETLETWIKESYDLVVASLTQRVRASLSNDPT